MARKIDLAIGLLFTWHITLLTYILPPQGGPTSPLPNRRMAVQFARDAIGKIWWRVAYQAPPLELSRLLRWPDRARESVLDIGCGIGVVAYDVAEKTGASVTGIDLIPASIAVARERFAHPNVTYVVGDALKDLPDQPFDMVILSNVLEHLPGRPNFLKSVLAAAKPSRILIRVPTFERDWRVPLKKELDVERRLDATHETEYTLESFAAEMDEAGLVIEHQAAYLARFLTGTNRRL